MVHGAQSKFQLSGSVVLVGGVVVAAAAVVVVVVVVAVVPFWCFLFIFLCFFFFFFYCFVFRFCFVSFKSGAYFLSSLSFVCLFVCFRCHFIVVCLFVLGEGAHIST